MQTNNHKLVDYDAVLDAKFGAEGTLERTRAEEEAFLSYKDLYNEDGRYVGQDSEYNENGFDLQTGNPFYGEV